MKENKFIIITTLFVLFLVFVLPGLVALGIKIIPGNDQGSYDVNLKRSIYGTLMVSQGLTPQKNNLTAIGISIGNPNLKNKSNVDFVLKDTQNNIVRKTSVNGASIGDGAIIRFAFDPIPDSKDKTYTFELSSGNAGPEEVINIYYSTDNEPWIGPAIFGEEINEKGLPIITYYSVPSRWGVVKEIYSNWLSRLLHLNSQKIN